MVLIEFPKQFTKIIIYSNAEKVIYYSKDQCKFCSAIQCASITSICMNTALAMKQARNINWDFFVPNVPIN